MATEGSAGNQSTKAVLPSTKHTTIFWDVFRRADKNDDGALSWDEFRTFFSDGILSTEELKTLFNEIDVHNTNNIDTEELCDYFAKHLGSFSGVLSSVDTLNNAVSAVLGACAKTYNNASFESQFLTRFLLKETMRQLQYTHHHMQLASEKIDEEEGEKRGGIPQAEIPGSLSPRGGRMLRKLRHFQQQTSYQGTSLEQALSSQVDRLSQLLARMETKVKLDIVEETFVKSEQESLAQLVCRKFRVREESSTEFHGALKSYVTRSAESPGCVSLSVRVYEGQHRFVLYEVWRSDQHLTIHFSSVESKKFQRTNIDCLVRPEEYTKMALPQEFLVSYC